MPSPEPSDSPYERLTAGDRTVVDELLQRCMPPLEAYVRRRASRLVQSKESVSDVLQSVCREACERLADGRLRFQGEEEFRHWLFQAALWKLQNRHDYYHAAKRDARREHAPPGPSADDTRSQAEALFRTVTTPSRIAVQEEHLGLLEEALELMPERLREVLVLARLEGASHREIAERLAITETASRSMLMRALARLSRILSAKLGRFDEGEAEPAADAGSA